MAKTKTVEAAVALKEEEEEEIRKAANIEKDKEGAIIRTWGTGTGKKTMSLHIRKSYYQNLGWDIGDFLFMEPHFDKNEIVIKKVPTDKLRRKR